MAKANENTIYDAFNIARAADGKNAFTFRHGLAELPPGAYATFKQWSAIGYKIEKGAAGFPVYMVNAENGKVTRYNVWSMAQVKATRSATIKRADMELLAAETAGKGLIKAETAARKYGELDADQIAAAYRAVCELYAEQRPERERRKNERAADAIKAHDAKQERTAAADDQFITVTDDDAAAGGLLFE